MISSLHSITFFDITINLFVETEKQKEMSDEENLEPVQFDNTN